MSSSSKPCMAVPLARAAPAGATEVDRPSNVALPAACWSIAYSAVIRPQGWREPNTPQPILSIKARRAWMIAVAGSCDKVSLERYSRSAVPGLTKCFAYASILCVPLNDQSNADALRLRSVIHTQEWIVMIVGPGRTLAQSRDPLQPMRRTMRARRSALEGGRQRMCANDDEAQICVGIVADIAENSARNVHILQLLIGNMRFCP